MFQTGRMIKMAAAVCPGSKIRSGGLGRGLGTGGGKGPIGVPVKNKLNYEELLKRRKRRK